MRRFLLYFLIMALAGCSSIVPTPRERSIGHIQDEPAPVGDIPPLVAQTPILPAPQPVPESEKYTVVVNDVPVRELLFALARDAKVNVDIHPGIEGVVTLNAVDQTLPQILDRIGRQVDMRYELHGDTVMVQPDTPYYRTYTVDYVNMSRDVTNIVNVQTEIDTTGSGDVLTGAGGGGTGAGLNNSATKIEATSNQRFWQTLVTNIAALLGETVEGATTPGELPKSASVIASPEGGVITVNATSLQHQQIQSFVDRVMANAQRQVLVEATIVEVELSDQYQAGIDWDKIAAGAGFSIITNTLAGSAGALFEAPFFTLRYRDPETRQGAVDITLRLLDDFGNVQVLSSPKIMVLNNQTALLKVVDNQVFFTIDVETTSTQGVINTTFDTTPRTVPVGFVMSVTPGIHENDTVIMNVRPTISRIVDFVNDPNPALAAAEVVSAIPVIRTREMESLLKVQSGQVAVLGGLMQDSVRVNTTGIPVLGDIPGVGEAFKQRNNEYVKTELVIFLRPLVIRNPSLEGDFAPLRPFLDPQPIDLDVNPPQVGSTVAP